MHDATKVLLGTTRSSAKDISNFAADPATFPAGTAVRLKSDGTLSVTKAHGTLVGVSLGRSLSDIKKTAVARSGEQVPIILTEGLTPVIGAAVWVDDVTGHANIADDGGVTTTVTNATYVTGVLEGIDEDGASVDVALIDMPGGL
jgi:hypothetical protein